MVYQPISSIAFKYTDVSEVRTTSNQRDDNDDDDDKKQYALLKRRSTSTKLHGAISHKVVMFKFAAVIT
jgi:hypothetical protein